MEAKRCPDGVEVVDYGPTNGGKSVFDAPRSGIWFRFRSEIRETYRIDISNLEDPLLLQFINLKTDDEIAEFFSRFGMILDQSEIERVAALGSQTYLTNLLTKAASGEPMTALRAVNDALSQHPEFGPVPQLKILSNTKKPNLTFEPQHLFGAMLLEAAAIAEHDVRETNCGNCGKVFITGSLTGRRAHAKFCSDRCRVAAMRKRQAEGK
jgi:endogenous inhibitor of DNA gyrase (YacG/DUF329 family)